MKERGIIQTTEQVRGLLDGSRTVIRVPLRDQGLIDDYDEKDNSYGPFTEDEYGESHLTIEYCPYEVGDMLYVRETYLIGDIDSGYDSPHEDEYSIVNCDNGTVLYYADHIIYKNINNITETPPDAPIWTPSCRMPKKYARLWLEVTSVKVEKDDVWNWCIEVRRVEK